MERIKPCLYDFHVHIGERIGGIDLVEDWKALNRIASRKGIAGIGAFVTEEQGILLKDKYLRMKQEAATHFKGYVHWHLTPVQSTLEDILPLLLEDCDLKFYSTYESSGLYSSYNRIATWINDLSSISSLLEKGLPRILIHCEDNDIIKSASERNPFRAPYHHCLRRPEKAENAAVEKVLSISLQYNYPIHIVHVSSPISAELIIQARKECSNPNQITCETAPHYLIYNENRLKHKHAHRYICSPPYRSEQSRGLLFEHLQDAVFNILASDHCHFSHTDKDRFQHDLAQVPCGIPGLETLYSSMHYHFVEKKRLSEDALLELCSTNPARLMKLSKPTLEAQ